MSKDIPEKRIFHDWSWLRIKGLWFWKGQIICRLFGHRVPRKINLPWCGRCGIALEEIYGLKFYNHYTVKPLVEKGYKCIKCGLKVKIIKEEDLNLPMAECESCEEMTLRETS